MGIILRLGSFDRAFANLSPDQQHAVRTAVLNIPLLFGHPHQHSGTGIRPFGTYYECRAGLGIRVLFRVRDGDFVLLTVGDHNHIRAYVKNNR